MMPDSLTLTLHMRFHSEDVERTGGDGALSRAQLLSKILESAADLSPELQKILEEFARQVNRVPNGDGGSLE